MKLQVLILLSILGSTWAATYETKILALLDRCIPSDACSLYREENTPAYKCGVKAWQKFWADKGGLQIGNNTYTFTVDYTNYSQNDVLTNPRGPFRTEAEDLIRNGGYTAFFGFIGVQEELGDFIDSIGGYSIQGTYRPNQCLCDPTLVSQGVPCFLGGPRRKGGFCTIADVGSDFYAPLFRSLFPFGARTVSVIAGAGAGIPFATVSESVSHVGMREVTRPIAYLEQNYTQLKAGLDLIIPKAPDVLLLMTPEQDCGFALGYLKERNFAAKATYTFCTHFLVQNQSLTVANERMFLISIATDVRQFLTEGFMFDAKFFLASDTADADFGSPTEPPFAISSFEDLFQRECPGMNYLWGMTGWVGGQVLVEAMKKTGNNTPAELIQASKFLDFTSFNFPITMTSRNVRYLPARYLQAQPTGPKLILDAYSIAPLIYPAPAWVDRFPPSNDFSDAEIAMYVLAAFGITVTIICLLGIILFHTKRVIAASSPIFLCLVCFGAGVAMGCIFFWRYTYITDVDCYCRIWFLAMGFNIAYSALFVRTLKIDRLWSAQNIQTKPLHTWEMALIFLGLVTFQIILLVIWSGVSFTNAFYVTPDPIRPRYNYWVCQSEVGNQAMIGIIVGYNAFLLFMGAILAYRVREVPMKVVNESRTIAILLYFVLSCSLLLLILELVGVARDVLFIIRSCVIVVGGVGIQLLLLGSKLTAKVTKEATVGSSVGTIAASSLGASPADHDMSPEGDS